MKKLARGFTLVELLVVIGIILILAGLLFPMVGTAMEKGRRTACRNNVRQAGLAFVQFSGDQGGWFPWAGMHAKDDLLEEIKNNQNPAMNRQQGFDVAITNLVAKGYARDTKLWVCPSDKLDGAANNIRVFAATNFARPPFNEFQNVSYMYIVGYNDKSLETPSSAPVLADESNGIENGAATPDNMPDITAKDNHGANYRNVLYFDGHAVSIEDANAANAIFDRLKEPFLLQSID